jgi:hypothetical protein
VKINISEIETKNVLSEVTSSNANEVVGGLAQAQIIYQGIVTGTNDAWQQIGANVNLTNQPGKSVSAATFVWTGGAN